MKILFVDDQPLYMEPVMEMFEIEGHQVYIASSGGEAVEMYSKNPTDVVILDYEMPDMTGGETFYALKEINPEVKAWIFSGRTSIPGLKELKKEGLLGHLLKPMYPRHFMEKVTRHGS